MQRRLHFIYACRIRQLEEEEEVGVLNLLSVRACCVRVSSSCSPARASACGWRMRFRV
jgi:hypothetical protein